MLCLNPACPSPENPQSHQYCQACGRTLLFHQHYLVVAVSENKKELDSLVGQLQLSNSAMVR